MKTRIALAFMLLLACLTGSGSAETACSKVSIEILQELTLERIAFDAKMVITNNIPDKDLTNIRVDVTIKDASGNVKNDMFFMKIASMNNIASVDGSGTVRAGTSSEVHWLIIPSPGAGGNVTAGTPYWAGATLTYAVDGKQEVVSVNPDRIIVKPEAQLYLDYFMPFEVIGDNPFTPQVEAPVSYPLAVRVLNAGFGPASKLKIDSAQPRIVDNEQGLLVDFRLLGASVNDSAVSPTLTVDIGTLDSMKIATAYWEMISTLSGHFVEFGVTFTHDEGLGGALTSLLLPPNAHYLVHRVKANLPGRDQRLDFLADTDRDPEHLPDSIYESEIPGGSTDPQTSVSLVNPETVTVAPPRPTAQQPAVDMTIATTNSGWVYAKVADPARGMLKILDVVRADGVHLDTNNFWISEGFDANYQQTFTFHMLDYRANTSAPGTYKLLYTQPADDTVAPTTSLIFNGPRKGSNPIYITSQTMIIFTATDNDKGSGVDQILKKIVGQDTNLVPAYPTQLAAAGSATLDYYSIDRAGNAEIAKTANLFVDNAAPDIANFRSSHPTITPNAPMGVTAARTTNFLFTPTDQMQSLDAVIEIAAGSVFAKDKVIRTLTAAVASGAEASITWDGKDKNNVIAPTGVYTARVSVSDGLNDGTVSQTNPADTAVTVDEWFKGQTLDPNLSGEQMYPEVSGTRVVWQDNRSGNWDIYTKEIGGSSSMAITSNTADQTRPSISGNYVVWQDNRNGNWDIYGYDLSSSNPEFPISTDTGDQERPVISYPWVAWQDKRYGNWDIYAYNLSTPGPAIRITDHERDQMHPAISGNSLVWEDYRHGLAEIYRYDLNSGIETRLTVNEYNQTLPAVSGDTVTWTDLRTGQNDIFVLRAGASESRVTYGSGDHTDSALLGTLLVFVDYETGADDPNLSFVDLTTGAGGRLSSNPARQEAPAFGTGMVAWQDNRDGVYQIYWSGFGTENLPIQTEIRPGFNLVAVGETLATAYPNASALIAANGSTLGITDVVTYYSVNGTYANSAETDIPLQKGMAIGIYASGSGTLDIGGSGETASYTLLPGTNYIGMLVVPQGYSAYALLDSLGLGNVQSVRRFNNVTGQWETAAVRTSAGFTEAVGVDFAIGQGDGLIITMQQRVDGWRP